MLEGPHLVAEAVAAGLVLETVLATPGFLATPEGSRIVCGTGLEPLEVAPDLLAELADADAPRGLLAVAHLPRRGVDALPVIGGSAGGVYLYVDHLQDPGNLGALARVAEAAGAVGLACSPGTVHPNHPRALRGSAGSLLRLPTAVGVEPAALERHLELAAPRWAALVPRGGEDLWDAPLDGTLLLALGAEGPGLSADLLGRAGLPLTIPLEPPVESLNATVAAALVLFEVRRRRRVSTRGVV